MGPYAIFQSPPGVDSGALRWPAIAGMRLTVAILSVLALCLAPARAQLALPGVPAKPAAAQTPATSLTPAETQSVLQLLRGEPRTGQRGRGGDPQERHLAG